VARESFPTTAKDSLPGICRILYAEKQKHTTSRSCLNCCRQKPIPAHSATIGAHESFKKDDAQQWSMPHVNPVCVPLPGQAEVSEGNLERV
jgi:hypothetical protein